jgi:hypothetical protein
MRSPYTPRPVFGLTYRLLQGCAALLALALSAVGVSRPVDGRATEAALVRAERTLAIAGELLSACPAPASDASRALAGPAPRAPAPAATAAACVAISGALLLGSARGPRAP